MTIWLSRSSEVRVKVRRWPQSPIGTIFYFSHVHSAKYLFVLLLLRRLIRLNVRYCTHCHIPHPYRNDHLPGPKLFHMGDQWRHQDVARLLYGKAGPANFRHAIRGLASVSSIVRLRAVGSCVWKGLAAAWDGITTCTCWRSTSQWRHQAAATSTIDVSLHHTSLRYDFSFRSSLKIAHKNG